MAAVTRSDPDECDEATRKNIDARRSSRHFQRPKKKSRKKHSLKDKLLNRQFNRGRRRYRGLFLRRKMFGRRDCAAGHREQSPPNRVNSKMSMHSDGPISDRKWSRTAPVHSVVSSIIQLDSVVRLSEPGGTIDSTSAGQFTRMK